MTLAPVYKGSPTPAYKITKAALNMLTVQYAQDYASEGFTFLAVSPGVSLLYSHFITVLLSCDEDADPLDTVAPNRHGWVKSRPPACNRGTGSPRYRAEDNSVSEWKGSEYPCAGVGGE